MTKFGRPQKFSDDYLLELVGLYKTHDNYQVAVNSNRQLPDPSTIKRRFGSWTSATKLAGLKPNFGGKFDKDKSTIIYLLDFGEFKKIGITQQSIKSRFAGSPRFTVLDSIETDLYYALSVENQIKARMVNFSYIPSDSWFERNGKTECFSFSSNKLEDLL